MTAEKIITNHARYHNFYDEIEPTHDLRHDLNLDQISIIGMSLDLETELHIEITDAETHAWQTVGDVLDMVSRKAF